MTYQKTSKILIDLQKSTPIFNYRNIIESIALLENKKKVMRLVVDNTSFQNIASTMEKLGLAVVRSGLGLKTSFRTDLGDVYTEFTDLDDPEAKEFMIMVAADADVAKYAVGLEDKGNTPGKLGKLLGYPDCCVSVYEKISEQLDWLTIFLTNTPHRHVYSYGANRMSYLFGEKSLFFDYFPCGLTCMETCNLSFRMTSILEKYRMIDLMREIKRDMQTPILIRKGIIIFLRDALYTADKQTLHYDLSKSRLHGWKVNPGAEKDYIWDSNRLTRKDNMIFFYQNKKYLGHFAEKILDDRLFIFE